MNTTSSVTVVIPCAADKLEGTHPARELYTSQNFRAQLAAAEAMAEGGQVLVLSAHYGLVELDQFITSYDVKLGTGSPHEISTVAIADQLATLVPEDHELYALLPGAYFTKLYAAAALVDMYPADVYEAAPGIGYQRHAVSVIRTTHAA